jgi:hypothetical protein
VRAELYELGMAPAPSKGKRFEGRESEIIILLTGHAHSGSSQNREETESQTSYRNNSVVIIILRDPAILTIVREYFFFLERGMTGKNTRKSQLEILSRAPYIVRDRIGDALSPPPRHDQHTIVADPTKSRERARRRLEGGSRPRELQCLHRVSLGHTGSFGSTVTVLFAFIFFFGGGS